MDGDRLHADRQLCVLSCDGDGIAYSWSVLGGPSDAISFRGFATTFQATTVSREVMDFYVQGPSITAFADLQHNNFGNIKATITPRSGRLSSTSRSPWRLVARMHDKRKHQCPTQATHAATTPA